MVSQTIIFYDKDKLISLKDKKSFDKYVGSIIFNLFTTILLKIFSIS